MSELAPSPLSAGIREWLIGTPLESIAAFYVEHLIGHGYAMRTMCAYVAGIAHFSHWLAGEHTGLSKIDETVVRRFLERHLPRCRCPQYQRRTIINCGAALGHLLKYLRLHRQVAAAPPLKIPVLIERDLKDFEQHLLRVRGVGKTTCYYRLNCIRAFYLQQFGTGPVLMSCLECEDIGRFITRYTSPWTVASRNTVCVSLRGYLRFKALQGEPTDRLAATIPKIAIRCLARLPDTVSAAKIERLFAAFDRSSPVGLRDLAIAHCLVDLGLRGRGSPALDVSGYRLASGNDLRARQRTPHRSAAVAEGSGSNDHAVPTTRSTGHPQVGRCSCATMHPSMHRSPPPSCAR